MANQIGTATGAINTGQPRVTGTTVGADHGLDVNIIGGAVTVNVGGSPLADINWDAVSVAQTSAVIETFTFKSGGLAGTTVSTCTVTYTSAARDILLNVVWT